MHVPSTQSDFDIANVVLDEAPCQQASLAERIAAKLVTDFSLLLIKVEGLQVITMHQLIRLLIEFTVSVDLLLRILFAEVGIEPIDQLHPLFE